MGVYDRQTAMALRLIKLKGQTITFRSLNATEGGKPWNGDEPVATDYPIDMAFIPVDRVDRDTQVYREYTDIPIGFVIGYMGSVPFVPKLKDVVLRDGKQLSVSRITVYKPNTEVIAYVLELLE